jgi:hypothetical protein
MDHSVAEALVATGALTREEARRLVEEVREGETETTPLIALSGLALWLGVLVAIVIALVFLIARLAS